MKQLLTLESVHPSLPLPRECVLNCREAVCGVRGGPSPAGRTGLRSGSLPALSCPCDHAVCPLMPVWPSCWLLNQTRLQRASVPSTPTRRPALSAASPPEGCRPAAGWGMGLAAHFVPLKQLRHCSSRLLWVGQLQPHASGLHSPPICTPLKLDFEIPIMNFIPRAVKMVSFQVQGSLMLTHVHIHACITHVHTHTHYVSCSGLGPSRESLAPPFPDSRLPFLPPACSFWVPTHTGPAFRAGEATGKTTHRPHSERAYLPGTRSSLHAGKRSNWGRG